MASNNKSVRKFKYFDWDKAKYFYYVVKFGSQTEASKFLNISQSTLSRKISILESELDCLLLSQNGRGLKVTRKGNDFFNIVEDHFFKIYNFTHNQKTFKQNEKLHIKISTTNAIAAYILNEHIHSYCEEFEDICFEINTNDYLIDLVLNDVELAIRPYDKDLKLGQQEYIFTLEKKLFASKEYIEKYGEPKTVDELKNHRIIAYSHPEDRPYSDLKWILRLGMPAGELHPPFFSSDSLECLIEATENGQGIFACYDEMSLVKKANIKQILVDVTDKPVKWFLVFPNYLMEDKVFLKFKNYLKRKFRT